MLITWENCLLLKPGMEVKIIVHNPISVWERTVQELEDRTWIIVECDLARDRLYFRRVEETTAWKDQMSCLKAYYYMQIVGDFDYSSKGKLNCPQCGCKTEMKRCFQTFEVREFCPRCKI